MQKRRSSLSVTAQAAAKTKNVCLVKMKSVVFAEDLNDESISIASDAIKIKSANGKLQTFSFDTVIRGNENEIESRSSLSPSRSPMTAPIVELERNWNTSLPVVAETSSPVEQLGASVASASKFVSLGFDSSIFIISRPRRSGPELEASMIEYQVNELYANVYPNPNQDAATNESESSAAQSPSSDMNNTGAANVHPTTGGVVMKRKVLVSVYEIFENRIRDLTVDRSGSTNATANLGTGNAASSQQAATGSGPGPGPRMMGDYIDGLNKIDCSDPAAAMAVIRSAFHRRTCMGVAQDVTYTPPLPAAAADGNASGASAAFPTFSDAAKGGGGANMKGFGTWSSSISSNTTGQTPSESGKVHQLKGYKNGRLLGPVGHLFLTLEVEQHVCALRKMQMRRRSSKLDIICLAAAELLGFKPAKHELISFIRLCDFKPDAMKYHDGVKDSKKIASLQDGLSALSTLTRVVKALRNDTSRPSAQDATPLITAETTAPTAITTATAVSESYPADAIHGISSSAPYIPIPTATAASPSKEATAEGYSLSPDRVVATGNHSSHVPYRDSLLTRLLRPSLEGNGCVFVVTLISSVTDNITNVLRFASDMCDLYHYIWTNETVEDPTAIEDLPFEKIMENLSGFLQNASSSSSSTVGDGTVAKVGDDGNFNVDGEEGDDEDGEDGYQGGGVDESEVSDNEEAGGGEGGGGRKSLRAYHNNQQPMTVAYSMFQKMVSDMNDTFGTLGIIEGHLMALERERRKQLEILGAQRLQVPQSVIANTVTSSSSGAADTKVHNSTSNKSNSNSRKKHKSSLSLSGAAPPPKLSVITEGDNDNSHGDSHTNNAPEQALHIDGTRGNDHSPPHHQHLHHSYSDGNLLPSSPSLHITPSSHHHRYKKLDSSTDNLPKDLLIELGIDIEPPKTADEHGHLTIVPPVVDNATLLLSRALREVGRPSPVGSKDDKFSLRSFKDVAKQMDAALHASHRRIVLRALASNGVSTSPRTDHGHEHGGNTQIGNKNILRLRPLERAARGSRSHSTASTTAHNKAAATANEDSTGTPNSTTDTSMQGTGTDSKQQPRASSTALQQIASVVASAHDARSSTHHHQASSSVLEEEANGERGAGGVPQRVSKDPRSRSRRRVTIASPDELGPTDRSHSHSHSHGHHNRSLSKGGFNGLEELRRRRFSTDSPLPSTTGISSASAARDEPSRRISFNTFVSPYISESVTAAAAAVAEGEERNISDDDRRRPRASSSPSGMKSQAHGHSGNESSSSSSSSFPSSAVIAKLHSHTASAVSGSMETREGGEKGEGGERGGGGGERERGSERGGDNMTSDRNPRRPSNTTTASRASLIAASAAVSDAVRDTAAGGAGTGGGTGASTTGNRRGSDSRRQLMASSQSVGQLPSISSSAASTSRIDTSTGSIITREGRGQSNVDGDVPFKPQRRSNSIKPSQRTGVSSSSSSHPRSASVSRKTSLNLRNITNQSRISSSNRNAGGGYDSDSSTAAAKGGAGRGGGGGRGGRAVSVSVSVSYGGEEGQYSGGKDTARSSSSTDSTRSGTLKPLVTRRDSSIAAAAAAAALELTGSYSPSERRDNDSSVSPTSLTTLEMSGDTDATDADTTDISGENCVSSSGGSIAGNGSTAGRNRTPPLPPISSTAARTAATIAPGNDSGKSEENGKDASHSTDVGSVRDDENKLFPRERSSSHSSSTDSSAWSRLTGTKKPSSQHQQQQPQQQSAAVEDSSPAVEVGQSSSSSSRPRKSCFMSLRRIVEEDDAGDDLSELEHRFLRAVSSNDVAGADKCLRMSVDVNVKNNFERDAMQIASRNGCVPMLQLLVAANGSLYSRGPRGDTLFHLAAMNGHLNALRWLHDRGAMPEAVDISGQTAMHIAARRGELLTLQYLIDLGCDVMPVDFDGMIPRDCIPRTGENRDILNQCRELMLQAMEEVRQRKKEKEREER